MKVDERKGDTLAMRHILFRIQQSDSAAAATDRRADSLARIAASSDQAGKLDEAARVLRIPIVRTEAVEGSSVTLNGRFIPSVGPWAFQGARPGESSELFDAEDGYYLARLDSITPGGVQQIATSKGRDIYDKATAVRTVAVLASKLASGDAGGAVLNNLGEVVGLAFAVAPDRHSTSYAVPTVVIREFLAEVAGGDRGKLPGACLQSK